MIKACLFDLDGVVFHTEPLYTEFWKSIFNEFYPTEQGLELKIKGQTLTQIYNRYFGLGDVYKRQLQDSPTDRQR